MAKTIFEEKVVKNFPKWILKFNLTSTELES